MNLDRTIPEGIAMVSTEGTEGTGPRAAGAVKDRMTVVRARALIIARIAWPIYVALLMSIFLAALPVRYLELTGPSQAVQDGLGGAGQFEVADL